VTDKRRSITTQKAGPVTFLLSFLKIEHTATECHDFDW